MIVGNKSRFAIEYELADQCGGEWLFGKICYWIGSKRVGDYESGTSLRDVFFQMTHLVGDCGNRDGGILCMLDVSQAFLRLNKFFYSEEVINESDFEDILPEIPARFNILIPVDIFDNCRIFLFNCGENEIVLFSKANGKLETVRLRSGECDQALIDFYELLKNLYNDKTQHEPS